MDTQNRIIDLWIHSTLILTILPFRLPYAYKGLGKEVGTEVLFQLGQRQLHRQNY